MYIQCMLNIYYEILNGILKGVLDGMLKVYNMVYHMYITGIENGILKACSRYIEGILQVYSRCSHVMLYYTVY